jgi:hypothetical protein
MLVFRLDMARQSRHEQDFRRAGDVVSSSSRSDDNRSIAGPRVPWVALVVIPAYARADSRDRQSAAAAVVVLGGRLCFFEAEDDFDCFFVFDNFGVSVRERGRC